MSNKIIHGSMDDLRCELEHTQQDCVKLYEKNQDLERQLEEARYSATDYAMKLGRANEKLEEARGLLMHTQRRVYEVKDFVNNGQLVTKYCNAICESIEDHLKEKGDE